MSHIVKCFLVSAIIFFTAACSKVTEKRLQGSWQVKEIKEIPDDLFGIWTNWLDTTTVKVVFSDDAEIKTFYLGADTLSGFSAGTYVLDEAEENLFITDISILFNPKGSALAVTLLRRNKLVLEGKYYLNAIAPSLPPDSFMVLQWTLEK